MIIAIGSDHAGFHLKEHVKETLRAAGHEVADLGTASPGNGVAIVANKVHGIRAVNAHDVAESEMARRHNDINVVTLSGARLTPDEADAIVNTFLVTGFEGGRHARRVAGIAAMDDAADPAPSA